MYLKNSTYASSSIHIVEIIVLSLNIDYDNIYNLEVQLNKQYFKVSSFSDF